MRQTEQRIEAEVGALANLGLQDLRRVWARRFGPAPKLRSVELLRLILAWRMQAEALGGLDASTRQGLTRRGSIEPEGRSLGHGAILRRIWQGRVIEAVVEADGFRFEGRHYPSLSAIAMAATGTRWNGPRFFGLQKEKAAGADRAASTGKPAGTDEPASTDKSTGREMPVSTGKSEGAERMASTGTRASTEKPASVDRFEGTDNPAMKAKPGSADKPTGTHLRAGMDNPAGVDKRPRGGTAAA